MTAIAISLLFGLVAFAAIGTIAACTARGIARGQAILGELAQLDRWADQARSSGINQSGRNRPAALPRRQQRPYAGA